MKNHLMIDLETLAIHPEAAIVQLAAVFFDPWTGETAGNFDVLVEPKMDGDPGMVELETLEWAKQHGTYPHPAGALLATTGEACGDFTEWLRGGVETEGCDMSELVVWAWGMDFDLPILENAMERAGMLRPWRYSQQRDARTVWKLAFEANPAARPHDALTDCMMQVDALRVAFMTLGIPRPGKEVAA